MNSHRGQNNALTGMQRNAIAGARAWLTGLRELRENPVTAYLELTEARRLARTPAWHRRIVPWLCFLPFCLAAGWLIIHAALASQAGTLILLPGQLPRLVITSGVLLVAVLFVIFLIGDIAGTAEGVFQALAAPAAGNRQTGLDDLSAVSLLTDREIVLGIVGLYWPRLTQLSLLGGTVTSLLLFAYHGLSQWSQGLDLPEILLYAPLTIAAMTLSGSLAGLLLVLCLIALGHGLRTVTQARLIAAALGFNCLVGLALTYALAGVLNWYGGPDGLSLPVNVLGNLLATATFLLLFLWMLDIAEPRPAFRRFLLAATPVMLAAWLGLVFLFTFGIAEQDLGSEMVHSFALSAVTICGALPVVNPVAVPAAGCLGLTTSDAVPQPPTEWFRYLFLVLQQVVMILIAARYARRAVRQRRAEGPWSTQAVNRQLDGD